MLIINAFYKGAGMSMKTEKSLEDAMSRFTAIIKDRLIEGVSIPEQIDEYIDQLEEMRRTIDTNLGCALCGYSDDRICALRWFVNIACLLKLKALKDDEYNGFSSVTVV